MFMLMGWMGVVGGLVGVLSAVGYFVSKKSGWVSVEKSSPFECGFTPSSSARVSFSLHFFLVALIFIVFDVELLLLYPYVVSFSDNGVSSLAEVMFFVGVTVFLSVGYFWEWSCEMLNWSW